MFGKKITVFLLPQGPHKIKKFTISRTLPWTLVMMSVIAFAGLIAFSAYTQTRYQHMTGQQTELERLRQKSAQQNVQLFAFADKIRLLEQEMAKLRQFDKKLRVMTDKAPLLKKMGEVGVGGSEGEALSPLSALKSNSDALIRQMHRDLDRLLAEASLRELSQQELGKLFEDTKSIIASTPDGWPLKGNLTSGFGYRSSPFGGSREFHRGIDISAPSGSPIVAPADGMVVSTDWHSGYGLIMVINHGYGVVSRYAHLSQAYVEPGQRVRRGERVAAVGMTGRTTGPHLHYEIILNGIPVNPMRFLAAKE